MRNSNPAALALALLLGHEARITDEQWSEVRAMALDRVCPHCDGEKVKFGETCWWCDGMGRVVQPDIVLTPIPSPTPPPCPACEAAAQERDDLRARVAAFADNLEHRHWHRTADAAAVSEQIADELRALLAEKEAK